MEAKRQRDGVSRDPVRKLVRFRAMDICAQPKTRTSSCKRARAFYKIFSQVDERS